MTEVQPDRMQPSIPVISILHDHLDVPSIVMSSACSIESMCVSGSTENVVLCAGTGNKNTDTTQHEHNNSAGIGAVDGVRTAYRQIGYLSTQQFIVSFAASIPN